jgi:hypothetical protein
MGAGAVATTLPSDAGLGEPPVAADTVGAVDGTVAVDGAEVVGDAGKAVPVAADGVAVGDAPTPVVAAADAALSCDAFQVDGVVVVESAGFCASVALDATSSIHVDANKSVEQRILQPPCRSGLSRPRKRRSINPSL